MTVYRTEVGRQTRYTLRDPAGLPCTLTFGAGEGALAEWKIVLAGTAGGSHLYAMQRFAAPVSVRLRAWLASIIGPGQAAELAGAVVAQPPRPSGWERRAPTAPGQ